eukprot:10616208-Lingulodinium_polyedra.AAC.1
MDVPASVPLDVAAFCAAFATEPEPRALEQASAMSSTGGEQIAKQGSVSADVVAAAAAAKPALG